MTRIESSTADILRLDLPREWRIIPSGDPRVPVRPGVGLVSPRWDGSVIIDPRPSDYTVTLLRWAGPDPAYQMRVRLPYGRTRLADAARVALILARSATGLTRCPDYVGADLGRVWLLGHLAVTTSLRREPPAPYPAPDNVFDWTLAAL